MKTVGSVLYYFGALLYTFVYFWFFLLIFLLTVLFDKERVVLHWTSRGWAMGLYRICPLWRIRISGREKIDRGKTYVIVTNHQAMLDIPLMYVLPLEFKWVSKREILRMPIFGWVLRMHGDICIERGTGSSARKMMRQAKAILDRGKTSVIMFPEGTRNGSGRIGRFKEGAFALAKYAGVGILPVVHEGNGSAFDGWRIRAPHTFRVRALDPIPADEVAAAGEKEMAERVRSLMEDECRTMRPDLYEK